MFGISEGCAQDTHSAPLLEVFTNNHLGPCIRSDIVEGAHVCVDAKEAVIREMLYRLFSLDEFCIRNQFFKIRTQDRVEFGAKLRDPQTT